MHRDLAFSLLQIPIRMLSHLLGSFPVQLIRSTPARTLALSSSMGLVRPSESRTRGRSTINPVALAPQSLTHELA